MSETIQIRRKSHRKQGKDHKQVFMPSERYCLNSFFKQKEVQSQICKCGVFAYKNSLWSDGEKMQDVSSCLLSLQAAFPVAFNTIQFVYHF